MQKFIIISGVCSSLYYDTTSEHSLFNPIFISTAMEFLELSPKRHRDSPGAEMIEYTPIPLCFCYL